VPYFSRGGGGGSLRRIWVNAIWDVRRSAGCTAWRKSRDARRGAGRKARGRWKARRGTQGREGKSVSPLEGSFHSWTLPQGEEESREEGAREIREGTRPCFTVG
jgi:hypothetical protein